MFWIADSRQGFGPTGRVKVQYSSMSTGVADPSTTAPVDRSTSITVSAIGPDAQAAIDAITELVAGKFNEAIRIHVEALVEQPEHPALLYNLACMEARGGRHLDALLHIQRAVELDPKWADYAAKDSDFAAIRNEPGFPA